MTGLLKHSVVGFLIVQAMQVTLAGERAVLLANYYSSL